METTGGRLELMTKTRVIERRHPFLLPAVGHPVGDPQVPALLSKAQAAAELGVSPQYLQRLIEDGQLPAVMVGAYWVLRADVIRGAPPITAAVGAVSPPIEARSTIEYLARRSRGA